MEKERSFAVDVLKTIGILGIILAHVDPPQWLFDIRVFDVCMLVFASGLTLKGEAVRTNYFAYLWKRFKRLVLPAWAFIAIYFVFAFILKSIWGQPNYSYIEYVQSFTFTGGMGYVWIIRVYLLMAAASPVIYKIGCFGGAGVKNTLIVIITLLLLNEFAVYADQHISIGAIRELIQGIILYAISYGVVEVLACGLRFQSRKNGALICVFLFILFFAAWSLCHFESPQIAKYPPRALYLLYGMAVSTAVYVICLKWKCRGLPGKCVEWISKNSLWIYFWHTLPVTLFNNTDITLYGNAVLKYIAALGFGVIAAAVQNSIRKKLIVVKEKNK